MASSSPTAPSVWSGLPRRLTITTLGVLSLVFAFLDSLLPSNGSPVLPGRSFLGISGVDQSRFRLQQCEESDRSALCRRLLRGHHTASASNITLLECY